jgi:hypothetical protein
MQSLPHVPKTGSPVGRKTGQYNIDYGILRLIVALIQFGESQDGSRSQTGGGQLRMLEVKLQNLNGLVASSTNLGDNLGPEDFSRFVQCRRQSICR